MGEGSPWNVYAQSQYMMMQHMQHMWHCQYLHQMQHMQHLHDMQQNQHFNDMQQNLAMLKTRKESQKKALELQKKASRRKHDGSDPPVESLGDNVVDGSLETYSGRCFAENAVDVGYPAPEP